MQPRHAGLCQAEITELKTSLKNSLNPPISPFRKAPATIPQEQVLGCLHHQHCAPILERRFDPTDLPSPPGSRILEFFLAACIIHYINLPLNVLLPQSPSVLIQQRQLYIIGGEGERAEIFEIGPSGGIYYVSELQCLPIFYSKPP